MPILQLFRWSPRPGQEQSSPDSSPASPSSSRFGALHTNVRSMINGSSVYSQSPNPNPNSANNTPKIPFLGFLRRPASPPAAIVVPDLNDAPRDSSDSRSPLRPQHTAGSYMRTIASLQDPREPETIYSRGQAAPDRHADVQLGLGGEHRHPADVPLNYGGSVDPETEQLQDEIYNDRRRRRRRHRRKKHHHRDRQGHWVRRRNERRSCCGTFVKGGAARGKLLACIISGLFLGTVLAIYLALALSRKDLGQEVHVLFIMIVLGTTIFFCHALIRLCMLLLHPPSPDANRPYIPSMTGPEGFQPIRPIRVHLARDDELGDEEEEIEGDGEGKEKLQHPPPAYGLWRSSVRVDPNLLHWQRVDHPEAPSASSSHPNSRNGSVSDPVPAPSTANEQQGPRPPSYVSDDGVSYVVEAAPRSVAPSHTGVSDIHPAWRPGYAISEVHMEEWPRTRQM